ncbi:MAG: TIGR02281 family clan AA aspartic protease [Halioglobus sp.]
MNKDNPKSDTGNMSTIMTALAWVAFMLLLGFYFNDVLEKQKNPNQTLSTQYSDGQIREVTLQRNKFGHYLSSGKLNGQSVTFMLDTGATGVAIPDHIARALKIERGRAYSVRTANGIATSFATRLDTVSVGEITLRNVDAGISPGLTGDEVLLGMSFLKHIEFTQRGNTLVLKQYF